MPLLTFLIIFLNFNLSLFASDDQWRDLERIHKAEGSKKSLASLLKAVNRFDGPLFDRYWKLKDVIDPMVGHEVFQQISREIEKMDEGKKWGIKKVKGSIVIGQNVLEANVLSVKAPVSMAIVREIASMEDIGSIFEKWNVSLILFPKKRDESARCVSLYREGETVRVLEVEQNDENYFIVIKGEKMQTFEMVFRKDGLSGPYTSKIKNPMSVLERLKLLATQLGKSGLGEATVKDPHVFIHNYASLRDFFKKNLEESFPPGLLFMRVLFYRELGDLAISSELPKLRHIALGLRKEIRLQLKDLVGIHLEKMEIDKIYDDFLVAEGTDSCWFQLRE